MYEEHDAVQTPTTEERKCTVGLESNPMEPELHANKKEKNGVMVYDMK